MSLYKRGHVWWYKFKFQGQLIRESTHSGRADIARDAEKRGVGGVNWKCQ
jgi:hypothetical protein